MQGIQPEALSAAKQRLLQKYLTERRTGSPIPPLAAIQKRAPGNTAPLSFHQEQVWLHAQIQAGKPAYNELITLHRHGPLDIPILEQSLNEVVRRHEIWRTTFDRSEGQPVQIIHDRFPAIQLPFSDLRQLPEAERRTSSLRLAAEDARRPFDLTRLPLWRLHLVQLSDDEYLLHMNLHQLIMDGVTVFQNFLPEVIALYAAFEQGKPSPLPDPALQYSDFAVWQRNHLTDQALAADLSYWKKQLSGTLPVLQWPSQRPRPPQQTFRGATEVLYLPPSLIDPLKNLAERESATLYMALTAGFVALLHRYTGQEDMILGSPAANRTTETRGMFGYFINMLPMRFDVSGSPSFRELLGRVRRVVAEALTHGNVPFLRLLRELKIAPDLSRNPLFQIMMTLEPMKAGLHGQWDLTQAEVSCGSAKVDLDLSLEAGPDGVMAPLMYNPDLLERAEMIQTFRHWETLLRGAVENPDQPIARLPVLTAEEELQIGTLWNQTRQPYPEGCFPELFEGWVRRTPQATAVVFENESLTYAELNRRANQLAHQLVQLGAGPESLVGLCLDRSLDLLIALVGILKSGAAYVPLDPGFPTARLALMMEDARCPIIVTQSRHRSRFDSTNAHLVLCDQDPATAGERETNPPTRTHGRHLAYLLFTSGSTGRPKGVEIEHRSLVNLLIAMGREIGFHESDTLLAVTTISFDIAGLELFLPLLHGGRIVIADSPDTIEGHRLSALLQRHDVTVMQATPTTWRLLIESGWPGKSNLRVLTGGEALPPDLAQSLAPRVESAWNVYGPTETTIWSSIHRISGKETRTVPIGRPIANTQFHVLDRHQQPVPVGYSGELYIGGDGLARGYFGRPEQTAERFVPHPLLSDSGQRLFRTGDQMRYLPDGDLEFQGRLDQQIKLRGYRIELGDIEAALAQDPAVQAAVAVVRGAAEDSDLVAFVVVRDGETLTAGSLRERLGKQLPGYMVPSQFILIPTLPLTPNGKVDRQALANSAGTKLPSGNSGDLPRTDEERRVLAIWREVLRHDTAGIHDSFFNLGGHSLLALRLVTVLRQRLALPVTLADLFVHPTVAGLVSCVSSPHHAADAAPIPRTTEPGSTRVPATSEQVGLWISHQLTVDPAAHNVVTATRLRGAFDLPRLERAWRTVIRRQDILRTQLRLEGGTVWQEVVELPGDAVDVEDLGNVGPEEREGVLRERLQQAARVRLDPATAPLWRLGVLRMGEEDHVIVFAAHHILVDEWSLHGLVAELAEAYRHDSEAGAALPDLPIRFADFAAWQHAQLQAPGMDAHEVYWRQNLDGIGDRAALPADRPIPAHPTCRGGALTFLIPLTTREALETLARAEGTTGFVTALAAWQAWLGRRTGERDIVVGTPLAQRERPEVEHLAGLFLQTLPMRARVDPAADFRSLVRQTRQRVSEAFAHAAFPLARMVGTTFRSAGAQSLFPTLFVLVDRPWPGFCLPGTTAEAVPIHNGAARFDLTLSLTPAPSGGWTAELEFSEDRFSPERAQQIADEFGHFIARVALRPDAPDFAADPAPLRSVAGLHSIDARIPGLTHGPTPPPSVQVADPHATDPDEHACPNLLALLEPGMEDHRDQLALVGEPSSISYGSLKKAYDQLALALVSEGVGPGVTVALCLDRSPKMIIGVLGILKAGGAYVPVDPNYPPGRIAMMLEDARPQVVVTDQSHAPLFQGCAARILLVERLIAAADGPTAGACPAGPADLAYVLFTSGSTGRPKGVAMPHRALVNLIGWQRDTSTLKPGEKTLQFAPISFDVSFQEILATLVQRGTLVLTTDEERMDPTRLLRKIRDHQVNRLILPFVALQYLAEAVDRTGEVPLSLREVFTSGEQLRITPAIAALFRQLPGCRFCNQYGPTEAHVVTEFELRGDPGAWEATPPIGRPIHGVRTQILAEAMQPVATGEEGELYLGGICLADGYLNRPDLTEARFVADPTSSGRRWYRTGDRAVLRADGNLEYRGRADGQVKVRGYRVEVGEIESVLLEHPAVRQAVVIAEPGHEGTQELVACVLPRAEAPLNATDLRRHLAARLPGYMMPSRFRQVASIPLSPAGKVDRSAVAAMKGPELNAEAPAVAPRSPLEELLCREWADVLARPSVGIHDSFFHLGGQSLLALRLVSRLQASLQQPVRLADLFARPTVAQFAAHLDQEPADPVATASRFRGRPSGIPWFHVPGIFGLEFLTPALAELIGRHRPYYDGLQYPGLDGLGEPLRDASSIATSLVTHIEAIHPRGPLWLSGYSFGGMVAHELARQLTARGRPVDCVVLFDTCPWRSLRRRPLPEHFRVVYERTMAHSRDRRLPYLKGLIDTKLSDLTDFLRRRWHPDRLTAQDRVEAASREAYRSFLPQPYAGRVCLLRSTLAAPQDTGLWAKSELNGWDSVHHERFEIINLPCDHQRVFLEPVSTAVLQAVGTLLTSQAHPQP